MKIQQLLNNDGMVILKKGDYDRRFPFYENKELVTSKDFFEWCDDVRKNYTGEMVYQNMVNLETILNNGNLTFNLLKNKMYLIDYYGDKIKHKKENEND